MNTLKIFAYISGLYIVSILTSCKKEKNVDGVASFTVINGMVGSSPFLVANFSNGQPIERYAQAMKYTYATYSSFNQSGSYSGMQPLALYLYPDTTVHDKPLLELTLDLKPNTINTLFVTGTVAAPDAFLTTDHPPYHETADSTLGIRFVNLFMGRGPVSVNIKGQANGSELSSLAYKDVTPFKKYTAKKGTSSYIFEFRDGASGVLIKSYTLSGIDAAGTSAVPNRRRYRNLTIGLFGAPDNALSQTVGLFETFTPN